MRIMQWMNFKPKYILCLFSYINFFFLLENGYKYIFHELKKLSFQLKLNLKIPKSPKRNKYIMKMRLVRNHTVIHWGGLDNKDKLNSSAGKNWGLSHSTLDDSLIDLKFGCASVVGADDRTLEPLRETHQICSKYLKEHDDKCAELFHSIVKNLPIEINGKKYIWTKPNSISY